MREKITFIEKLALRLAEIVGIAVLIAVAVVAFDQIKNPLLAVLCSFTPFFIAFVALTTMTDTRVERKSTKPVRKVVI